MSVSQQEWLGKLLEESQIVEHFFEDDPQLMEKALEPALDDMRKDSIEKKDSGVYSTESFKKHIYFTNSLYGSVYRREGKALCHIPNLGECIVEVTEEIEVNKKIAKILHWTGSRLEDEDYADSEKKINTEESELILRRVTSLDEGYVVGEPSLLILITLQQK